MAKSSERKTGRSRSKAKRSERPCALRTLFAKVMAKSIQCILFPYAFRQSVTRVCVLLCVLSGTAALDARAEGEVSARDGDIHAGDLQKDGDTLTAAERAPDKSMELKPEYTYPPGTCIRTIHIHIHEVFDADRFILAGTMNALHWTSTESSVRRELLYSEGSEFRQDRIDESERILRKSGRFIVEHTRVVPAGENEVDIYLEMRDILSLIISLQPGLTDISIPYSITLGENNVLGQGIGVTLFMEQEHFFTRWYQQYDDPRFLNSHWHIFERAGFRYDTDGNHTGEEAEIRLERPLFSRSEKWGWLTSFTYDNGLVVKNREDKLNQVEIAPGIFRDEVYYRKNLIIENRLTRSFGYTNKLNIGVFIRNEQDLYRVHESLQPEDASAFRDASLNMKNDSTRHKAGIALAANNHRWIRLRGYQNYGIIEDFPLGSSLETTLSTAQRIWGSDENALYMTLELANNSIVFKNQLAQFFMRYSSTFAAEGGQRDMVTTFRYIHHFRDVPLGTLSLRAETTFGERLEDEDFLSLGNSTGLRGYTDNRFAGDRLLLFSAEYRFDPIPPSTAKPAGRRLAFVAFADLGSCWYNHEHSLRAIRLYPGVGIGIRITTRNFKPIMSRFDIATNFGNDKTVRESVFSAGIGHAF